MHLIRHFSFETRTSSRALGEKLARKLPDLLSDSVLPKLDGYLEELPPEIDIRIDQLICDLGPISFSRLEQDLPRLIADSLLRHFKQSLTPSSTPIFLGEKSIYSAQVTAGKKQVHSSAQSQLEALLYLLAHGHFPWWFPAADWPSATRVDAWPAAQSAALHAEFLRCIRAGEPGFFHRFIRHVSAEAIAGLLEKTSFKITHDFSPTQLASFQKFPLSQRTTVLSLIWLQLGHCHNSEHHFHPSFWEKIITQPDVKILPNSAQSLLKKILFSTPSKQPTAAEITAEVLDLRPEVSPSTSEKRISSEGELFAERKPLSSQDLSSDFPNPSQPPNAENAPPDFPIPDSGFLVPHAGLVLLHPFIPPLFQGLGWLDGKKQILPTHRWHAVSALQYLTCGDTRFSEASLLLGKILCGLPIAALADNPILAAEVLTECDALLAAAIQHWTILGKTSPSGLRESFLRRSGLLTQADGTWRLHVERQAIDVLLGQLPWPLSIVKFPWMKQPLNVTWAASN